MSTTCGSGKPTDLKVSICVPRSCSESELKLALNHLRILPMTTNQYLNHSMNQDKFVCDVTCRPVDFQPDYLFRIVTVVLGTIVLICLFATVFDYYHEIDRETFDKEKMNELKKKSNEEDDGRLKFLLAFSMLTNGRSLLRVSNNPNNLKGVECIR
ncbi:hypothetical protein B9Z55_014390 [Caenorhabditis nigoni]|nr:hypothetical protein B9Z55_014390 [Caenorhabditis nigoni]